MSFLAQLLARFKKPAQAAKAPMAPVGVPASPPQPEHAPAERPTVVEDNVVAVGAAENHNAPAGGSE